MLQKKPSGGIITVYAVIGSSTFFRERIAYAMKNKLKKFKNTLLNACLYFTVAIFIILILAEVAELSSAFSFLSLSSTAMVFVACFLISVLNFVWKLEYSASVRTLIHFTCTFAVYGLLFIIIPGAYKMASQLAARSVIFVVAYVLIAFIVLLISSIRKNRRSDDMEYESQFGEFFDK